MIFLKNAGVVIAVILLLYNYAMFLAICFSRDVRKNMTEFGKFIGVPSLVIAGALLYFCH